MKSEELIEYKVMSEYCRITANELGKNAGECQQWMKGHDVNHNSSGATEMEIAVGFWKIQSRCE